MGTIMFCPFPEIGHLNPTLKLAQALKQAGHRVCYLGLADFEEYVLSQGLEFIPILESRYPKGTSGERSAQMKLGRLELIMLEEQQADAQVTTMPFKGIKQEIGDIIRDNSPDLLIVDFLIGGLAYIVAQEFGVASAVLCVTLLEGWMLGEPAPGSVGRELPVLVLCPEAFDFPGTPRKANRHYIEPSVDLQRQELQPFDWDALDPDKPLIYCSLGSESHLYEQSPEIFRAAIEAVGEKAGWQMVLAVGPYLKVADFEPLPANVMVVNWAPQLKMLERAAMMITHGGLGAVKECILLGVPMIVFPCRWDQPFNAARVVAHGLGLRGNINQVTARQVGRLIETVAGNPSFKRRMEAMSRTFREIENSGIGVKILERIIRDFSTTSGPPAVSIGWRDSLPIS